MGHLTIGRPPQATMLAILCGMEAEAAALGRWRDDRRVAVAITGGRSERAEAEADRLAASGARALLSFGIAGGLDPELASGTLVVADGVIVPGGRPLVFDPGLIAACRQALAAATGVAEPEAGPGAAAPSPERPAVAGALLLAGSDAVLLRPAAKAALRRRTGAIAVDMESHRVAVAARRARLPALALRAVSDPAGRRLPALVTAALDAAGRPRIGAVLGGIARRPWDVPALLAAGRDSRAALAALGAAADAVIPALLARMEEHAAR